MAGSRFYMPYVFWANSGGPEAGGQLFFFISGTDVPAPTYSNSGLTVPNQNPVVANAGGFWPAIFLDPTITYKVVHEDANGAQVWTADPYSVPTGTGNYPIVYVDQYGAQAGNLVADSYPAFEFCLATFPVVRFQGAAYRLSAGILVPAGCDFGGDSFVPNENTNEGSMLVFDGQVPNCVTLIGGGSNGTCRISNLVISRAVGVPPADSIGLYGDGGYNIQAQNVCSQNHAEGIYLKATGVVGISARFRGVYTAQITDAHIVCDTWPEASFIDGRIGSNGGNDVDCNAYIRITGGGVGGDGPNTLFWNQVQFNQGANAPAHFCELVNVSHTDSNALEFKWSHCHIEGVSGAIFFSDDTCAILNRVTFTDNVVNCPTTPMWALNAATQPEDWSFVGNQLYVSDFSLAPTSQFNGVSFVGNRILSGGTITIPADSTLGFVNSTWGGDLTIAGAGNCCLVNDQWTAGALVITGTGKVTFFNAEGDVQAWTPNLEFGGADVGVIYASQVGTWQLIGGFLTCDFRLTLTSKGTSNGVATISNLPFPSDSTNGVAGACVCYSANMATLTGPVIADVAAAGGTISNFYHSGAAGVVQLTDANFTNTSVVYGTLTYRV